MEVNCFEASLTSLDLYSIPFYYNLKKTNKTNKTLSGGLCSLLIALLSLSYLTYLTRQYFNNEIQPTVSQKITITPQFSVKIPEDAFSLKIILSDGQNLIDYQKQSNKTLLLLGIEHKYFEQQGNQLVQSAEYFKLSACTESNLQGQYCINYSKGLNAKETNITSLNLNYDNSQSNQDKITLLIAACVPSFTEKGEVCEDDLNLVKQLIVSLNTQIFLFIKLNQFNPQTKQVEATWKSEKYFIDPLLSFISQILLKKDDTTLIDGFLIQKENRMTYINDYQRTDTGLNTNYVNNFFNLNMFGCMIFYLNEFNSATNIQYIAFPSLLAQFSSVFSVLILAGLFCKKISEADIISDLITLLLKVKYKESLIGLMANCNSNSSNVIDNYKNLNQFNLKNKFASIFGVGFFGRLALYFVDYFKESAKRQNNISNEKSQFIKMIEEAQKYANIYEIQRQLIEIQMMLKLLFTEEQYAAIKLCGLRIPQQTSLAQNYQCQSDKKDEYKLNEDVDRGKDMIDINNQQQLLSPESEKAKNILPSECQINPTNLNNSYVNKEGNVSKDIQQNEIQIELAEINALNKDQLEQNHLEKLEQIETDSLYFESNVSKFIQQFKQNPNSCNEIDKRIFQSMLGNNQQPN